jgi:ABC-type transporter Mla subunit MlaD
VQLNGNRIGEVEDITNDVSGGVVAILSIENAQPVHEHARFSISRESIFGSYLVSIDERRSGRMDEKTPDGGIVVYFQAGTVSEGAPVLKDGETIGWVESTSPTDKGRSDRAVIRLTTDAYLDNTMAFVPANRGLILLSDPSRPGFPATLVKDGTLSVRIPSGQVEIGAPVVRDGEPIGQITSVTSIDQMTEDAVISLVAELPSGEPIKLIPPRPIGTGPAGVVVYESIPAGSERTGVREPGPEDLIPHADEALKGVTDQATAIMSQITSLLSSFEELMGPEDIRTLLDTISSEATLVADNIATLTERLNMILVESQPHITGTLENIEGITSDAQTMMEGLNRYTDPELFDQIDALLTNLTEASDRLNSIMTDVQSYTSDEQLKEDIAGTFHEAHLRLQEAQGTLESVSTAIEEATTRVGAVSRIRTTGEFTMRYAPEPDHVAGDLNLRFSLRDGNTFGVAGIDDIGENDRANVQVGWWINDSVATRAGIHRGKLGVGLDWRSDVYDPNDMTWDVYAGYAILPELDIVVGVEDLLQEDDLNFGLTFRF